MSSQNSVPVTSASLGGGAWPIGLAALLTRMSMPPSRSWAVATIARTEASSPVSTVMAWTSRPVAAAISSADSSSAEAVRAATATSQPSAASVHAIALPMPLLPPVTSARLPVSWRSMCSRLARDDPATVTDR